MKTFFHPISEFINQKSNLIKDKKQKYLLILSALFFVIFFGLLSWTTIKNKNQVSIVTPEKTQKTSDMGIISKDVDSKLFVNDMEKDYFELKQKVEDLTGTINGNIKKISDDQKFIGEYLEKLTDRLDAIDKKVQSVSLSDNVKKILSMNSSLPELANNETKSMKIEHITIAPIEVKEEGSKNVHLPMGSYCKGTLITGVHAPSDQTNPLPVLIRLDEAFIGPNQSTVPLKGTFVLGSAYGDLVSKRAYIEVYGLSTILPGGTTFEKNIASLGYIGDEKQEFGLPGVIVSTSANDLGISFLAGFLGGASQAFADAETTSVVGSQGTVTKSVTGSATKNATFQGLATSASNLSEYYQKQVEKIVPSIRIHPGTSVYFYIQKGITIEGLKADQYEQTEDFE